MVGGDEAALLRAAPQRRAAVGAPRQLRAAGRWGLRRRLRASAARAGRGAPRVWRGVQARAPAPQR